jgi:fructokinase
MAHLLGDRGIVASRIGEDQLGREIRSNLARLRIDTSWLQVDTAHPTGTVEVQVDVAGQPEFRIAENVAWDYLECTPAWQQLAHVADVVCFGTLAQRAPASRATIRKIVASTRPSALRVFDVNFRAPFYSADVLRSSLELANVVKVNDQELPQVADLLQLPWQDEERCARSLLAAYQLKLVCVTRGARGSLLVDCSATSEHPGFHVDVADTVGAGDAFTACLAHHLARNASLDTINAQANRFAAWVASQPGGTPSLGGRALQEVLGAIGAKLVR